MQTKRDKQLKALSKLEKEFGKERDLLEANQKRQHQNGMGWYIPTPYRYTMLQIQIENLKRKLKITS